MVSDLAAKAFEDLDEISEEASRASAALDRGDVETAQDVLDDIKRKASTWDDAGKPE